MVAFRFEIAGVRNFYMSHRSLSKGSIKHEVAPKIKPPLSTLLIYAVNTMNVIFQTKKKGIIYDINIKYSI